MTRRPSPRVRDDRRHARPDDDLHTDQIRDDREDPAMRTQTRPRSRLRPLEPAPEARRRDARVRRWSRTFFLAQGALGVWAYLRPHGFYTGFPFPGSDWLTALGAFDGHLVRDLGISWIALAVVGAWTARRAPVESLRVTLAAFVVAGGLHLAYHVTTFDRFGLPTATAQAVSLIGLVAIPAALLHLSRTEPRGQR